VEVVVMTMRNRSHEPADVLERSDVKGWEVLVRKEVFAVAKVRSPLLGCFAIIDDGREITVVIDQSLLSEEDAVAVEYDWRLITFDAVLPFDVIGFLATVSTALAEEGVSVFVISAYSTDHILVKGNELDKALTKLQGIGFVVRYA
jgi:hypothetical protein